MATPIRFGQPFPTGALNAAIRREIVAHRLMQQHQIDERKLQPLQRGLHRLIHALFRFLILYPYLGRNEQLFAGNQPFGHGPGDTPAYRAFVPIGSCGIQQPVTGFDRVADDLFALSAIRNLKYAKDRIHVPVSDPEAVADYYLICRREHRSRYAALFSSL